MLIKRRPVSEMVALFEQVQINTTKHHLQFRLYKDLVPVHLYTRTSSNDGLL